MIKEGNLSEDENSIDIFFLNAITPDYVGDNNVINFGLYSRCQSKNVQRQMYKLMMRNLQIAQEQFGFEYEFLGEYGDTETSSQDSGYPELQRLIRDINEERVNAIVAVSLSQLTRVVLNAGELLTYLQSKGVSLLILENPSEELCRSYSDTPVLEDPGSSVSNVETTQ